MCCSGVVNIECVSKEFIRVGNPPDKEILFSGLIVTEGSEKVYISTPYQVTKKKDIFTFTYGDGEIFTMRTAQSGMSVEEFKSMIADCSGGYSSITHKTWVSDGSGIETSPVAFPEDITKLTVFRNGILVEDFTIITSTTFEILPSGTVEAGEIISIVF